MLHRHPDLAEFGHEWDPSSHCIQKERLAGDGELYKRVLSDTVLRQTTDWYAGWTSR